MLARQPNVVEMQSEGSPSWDAKVEKLLMSDVFGRSSATTRHVLIEPRSKPFNWNKMKSKHKDIFHKDYASKQGELKYFEL